VDSWQFYIRCSKHYRLSFIQVEQGLFLINHCLYARAHIHRYAETQQNKYK